jgi:multidrug efflux pump
MQFPLTQLAVRKPATIFLFMVLLAVAGVIAYRDLPREASPDIDWPHLYVTIPFPGATPGEVEAQITNKVEQELQNVDKLEEMRSRSANNLVTIDLKFAFGHDLAEARNKVREALERVRPELPDEADDWIINDFNLSEQPIMVVNLSSDAGLFWLKEVADDLRDRIKAVPGVLAVNRVGGLDKEVQVRVDAEKLRFYHLDLNSISSTITAENRTIPGGTVNVGPRELFITIPGEVSSIDEIRDMIIADYDGASVRIGDVADVRFTFRESTSHSRLNGVESVSLEVSKRIGENLTTVSREIRRQVDQMQAQLGEKVTLTVLHDDATWVDKFVRDLENNIYTGMLFVFLVLFLFLGRRNAVFVGIAIPFSMLMSFLVLSLVGITLNFIVLFSLIISLGLLVDNAIVIVENIYRHVQSGKSTIEAAIAGASEVAAPVITSTLTTLLAFFPLVFMPGIMGEFMNYLPKTLIITLSCSLVVGLLFNPVVCSRLMQKPTDGQTVDEVELVNRSRLLVRYRRMLEWVLGHRLLTLSFMAVFWIGMMGVYFQIVNPSGETEFFPKEEPREAVIRITAPQGTILEESDQIVRRVEDAVLPFRPYTDSIMAQVAGTDSRIKLGFPDWEHWTEARPSEIVERLRQLLPQFWGAEIRLDQRGGGGPPVGRDVNVEIKGDDLAVLKAVADDIKDRIVDVPGLVNLETSADSNRSRLNIAIDREKIARHGLRTAQLAAIIRTAFNGEKVSSFRRDQDEYDIIVRLDERYRQYDTDLSALYVMTPQGKPVPLSELATIRREPAEGAIHRLDLKRIITVEADASNERSGAEVLKEVRQRLADYPLPTGMTLNYAGADATQDETQDFLVKSFGVAVFLIFMLLVTQFNSLMLPFIILASVFASLSGVFLGMSLHGTPISILMGGIGVISLAGIVVNNAIVLIDYTGQLRSRGYAIKDAIVTAGMVRLRPVILTAVTTILGLIPITLGMDIDFYRWPDVIRFGSEGGTFWRPMNLSIIYGLSVATLLTLFLVPVLYSLNESGKQRLSTLIQLVGQRLKKRPTGTKS